MTVAPGFGGQKLLPDVLDKVRQLRRLFPSLDIQVDGGITAETAPQAVAAGANILVAGSAVFGKAASPLDPTAALRAAVGAIKGALSGLAGP